LFFLNNELHAEYQWTVAVVAGSQYYLLELNTSEDISKPDN